MKPLSGIYATRLVKLADKMDEICINGKFSVQEPREWTVFWHTCRVILLYFTLEYRLITVVLELGQVRLFWKLIRSRICATVTELSNRCLRVFDKQFSIKIVKYEDGILILGQNVIFCGHNVVHFSVWFPQLTVLKYLVATHAIEPGSFVTEPGTVIKFSQFSSHPGTCML